MKWLARGYKINDESCSHCLIFPLIEKNIRVEPQEEREGVSGQGLPS